MQTATDKDAIMANQCFNPATISLPGASLKAAHARAQLSYLAAYTPESITAAALSTGTPRSAEYRAGLLDVLKFKMRGERIICIHQAGTAQFDAYMAGNLRGFDVYRAHLEQQGGRHD
ncbi:MAG: hypothetical protein IPG66_16860 [Hydrogenophilales bacterium]|nr:hypothetical protein [Hydrogenophilales bacterium]